MLNSIFISRNNAIILSLQVDKMHSQLQKKLDNRRAELENLLRDNREFEDQCGQLQEWLGDCARLLVDALRVSADRDILRRQLQDNEPAYKDVMDREHEVIMMLDKGQELANQSPNKNDAKAFNKLLERIRGDWNKVRQETVNRHRRLQTCMELCRKYDASQETLLPWLDQAEEKFHRMQPVAFKKSNLDLQVRIDKFSIVTVQMINSTFFYCKGQGTSSIPE